MLLSILYFFVVMFCMGYSLLELLKTDLKQNNLINIIIMFSVGIAVFSIVSNIINILRVPLHWSVFLVLSLIIPIYKIIKTKKIKKLNFDFNIKKNYGIIIALILGLILFVIYFQGATGYNYLENDDPWDHALASKYIATEKTAFEPSNFDFHYLDPYPPTFDIMMGILHQLNDSIYLTLNLFNALLCGLAIIFFYIFSKEIFKEEKYCIFSTFLLFSIPSFMSHFIWSQTLALTMFFPAWYFLIKGIKENKFKNFIISGLISAGILISQPSTAFNFVIMTGIIVAVYVFASIFDVKNKKYNTLKKTIKNYSVFLISIIILAGIYWFTMFGIYGFTGAMEGVGFDLHNTIGAGDTSGGIVYTLKDFIFAPTSSKMDQPTGFGWMISILLIPGIIYIFKNIKNKKERSILLIVLFWLIFAFLGTQGNALPIKLFPHRFWAFLSIPIVLTATYGLKLILNKFEDKNIHLFIIGIIAVLVIISSGYPKYIVETSHWPPGVRFTSYDEVGLYSAILRDMPKNSKVFMYTTGSDSHIIGVDMYSPSWNSDVINFRKNLINKSTVDVYNFLLENEYEYMILGGISFKEMSKEFGANETQQHINNFIFRLENETYFSVVSQNKGAALLKVN